MRFVNRIKQKCKNNRKIVLMTIIFFVSFLFCESALGWGMEDVYGYGLDFISWIVYGIVIVIGELIGLFVGLFLVIIKYNTFINAEPVIIGWEIIRDICNMGFVIVLLIIAIASILQIQTYHYRTWLPKLILMAILINFSKLICGILIDASQIITLTFASGIQQIGAGNFMDALGINHLLNMNFGAEIEKNKEVAALSAVDALSIMGTIFLTLIVALIALVVIAAITLIFIIRIVVLWILIILSPFAYLFSASPLGHQYASQWWQKFSQWVIVGPVMLFFIWLSLLTIKNLTSGMFSTMAGGAVPTVGLAEIGSPETMGAFILACVMLMASLIVAQQLGGYAGKIAGGAYGKITSTGDKIVGGGLKVVASPYKGAKELGKVGVGKFQKFTGVDLNIKRVWEGMKSQRADNRAKDYLTGQQKAGELMSEAGRFRGAMAMSSKPGEMWNYVMDWKNLKGGYRERRKGGKELTKIRKELEKDLESVEIKSEGAKFRSDFVNKTNREQIEDKRELTSEIIDLDDQISGETDTKKLEELKKKRDITDKRLKFADVAFNRNINSENTDAAVQEKVVAYQKQAKKAEKETENLKDGIHKNISEYSFEARTAEEKLVREEMSKIGDIKDSNELNRMLRDAVRKRDKARIKAISKQMTKNADENEYLQEFGFDTNYKGLQNFMRSLSDKSSKNYAGFSQQEAYRLGADVSEMVKMTDHWAATGAYTMKNGQLQESSTREHIAARNGEMFKRHLQYLVRNNNRLAYGKHDKETGKFYVDEGGLVALKMMDHEKGWKEIQNNGQLNAMQHLNTEANVREMKLAGISQNLIDAIQLRLGTAKTTETGFDTNRVFDEIERSRSSNP